MGVHHVNFRLAAGFSLIEVLVALAISVMVVGIGLPAISDSLSRQSDARSHISAVSLARSKIEEFTALTGRADLPRSGTMNDLRWQVAVSEVASSGRSGIAASLMMERVVVEVLRDQGATPVVSLTSFRLKRMTSP